MSEPGETLVVESLLSADLKGGATVSLLGTSDSVPVLTDSRGRAVLQTGRLISGSESELKGPLVFRVEGLK